jgi:hypothetical protein
MRQSKLKRGQELSKTVDMKLEIQRLCMRAGALAVFFEEKNTDVLSVWPRCKVAFEIDLTAKNEPRNALRDLAGGAGGVVIACPDFAAAQAVSAKLLKYLPRELASKVGILTINVLGMLLPDEKGTL